MKMIEEKLIEKGLLLIGLTTLMAASSASQARADLLGHVIVGGITNQALTQVTQNACPDATGAGVAACDAADTVVDVHRDVSNAVNQEVQHTCQNATGAGEDACQGIDDVNSFKKQLSEQVDQLHLFGSHNTGTQSSPSENESPSNTQNSPSSNGSSPSENSSN